MLSRLGSFPIAEYAGPVFFEPGMVALGDDFVFSDPKRGELRIISAGGQLRRIIRLGEGPPRLSDDEWRRRVLGMLPQGAPAEQRERFLSRTMPLKPASMPVFGRIRVDWQRRIWIQDPDERRRWFVLTPFGAILGSVDIPQGELAGFVDGALVVHHRDADGAPHLRLHRVLTGARGR